MTTISQAGILSFGPQAGKEVDVPTGKWYRHKARLVDMAVIDDTRLGPPEVGGRPLPTLPYKGGVMVGGGLTFAPRLECSVGWLLYGALGYVSTSSGSGSVKEHTFKMNDTYPGYVPYMGFRKYIPSDGQAGNYGLGETYKDCKVLGLSLTLPNDGLIDCRVDALGRLFTMEQDPAWGINSGSAGGYDPTYGEFEDYPSVPISTSPGGYIYVPDIGFLPVIQCMVTIQNRNLDPRMEKVYGSPYLEDVTVVSRAVAFDLTVKWRNPDLYRQILTGNVAGTQWTADPFTSGITFRTVSPANMSGCAQPYELLMTCTEAMLAMQGGIQLAGADAVLMRFAGTALDTTGDYVTFKLVNKYASYTWPT